MCDTLSVLLLSKYKDNKYSVSCTNQVKNALIVTLNMQNSPTPGVSIVFFFFMQYAAVPERMSTPNTLIPIAGSATIIAHKGTIGSYDGPETSKYMHTYARLLFVIVPCKLGLHVCAQSRLRNVTLEF